MRMQAVKTAYNDNTVHLEARKGTRDQARAYCQKEQKFTESGTWISGQGHRSDLDTLVDKLVAGEKLSDLMLEHPKTYCQYRNGLRDIAAAVPKKRSTDWRDVEVILTTGPTGCGKTRAAMREATYKIQGSQLKWWQDYDGEAVICIDEYANDVPCTVMQHLLDGYRVTLPIKGSHTYAAWTKVYITTNLRVEQIHAQAEAEHRAAFWRRVDTIIDLWPNEAE